jgi:streptomycin 6-kinase
VIALPDVVRNKATTLGATAWLDGLDALVEHLCSQWSLRLAATYAGGTEAYVAAATLPDGTECVLKVPIPRPDDAVANERTALRLADGEGCARLLAFDDTTGAMLIERLGRSLFELDYPIERRLEILSAAAQRIWSPVRDTGLPTGEERARGLAAFIWTTWELVGRPCALRTVEHATSFAARRAAAHRDDRAVLVHGDVHQWNALEAPGGFKLVDPDGLVAEPECDLGILMREDPLEGDLRERAAWLAARCSLDAAAIWEWGVVERVSTGLLATQVGLEPHGRDMLAVADRLSAASWE